MIAGNLLLSLWLLLWNQKWLSLSIPASWFGTICFLIQDLETFFLLLPIDCFLSFLILGFFNNFYFFFCLSTCWFSKSSSIIEGFCVAASISSWAWFIDALCFLTCSSCLTNRYRINFRAFSYFAFSKMHTLTRTVIKHKTRRIQPWMSLMEAVYATE